MDTLQLPEEISKLDRKWKKILKGIVIKKWKKLKKKEKAALSLADIKLIRRIKNEAARPRENDNEKALLFLLEKMSKAGMKRDEKRVFIVLSGPSGAGKGTYGKELEKLGFHKFPTTNTRLPRPEDRPGVDFIFVSVQKFHALAQAGEFLQFRKTHGDWHGISRRLLEKKIKKREKFYLERSVFSLNGFFKAMKKFAKKEKMDFPNYLSIVFLPPSFNELYRRLVARTKKERLFVKKNLYDEELLQRFKTAIQQLQESARAKFDLYIVNDRVPRVMSEIMRLIK